MLALFRINDPSRLILLVILLVFIRMFFSDFELQWNELDLHAQVLGKKLSMQTLMYRDIWDNTAPVTAGIYWLVVNIFPSSALTFQILSALLILYQGFYLNRFLIRFDVLSERNYVPAFLYVVLIHFVPQAMSFSPLLIGLTFLLYVMRFLLALYAQDSEHYVFQIGLYMSLAVLTFQPYLLFFPIILLSFSFFRSISVRYLVLLLFGFLFPILLVFSYYFFFGAHTMFLVGFLLDGFSIEYISEAGWDDFLVFGICGLALFVWAVFRVLTSASYNNFQERCQRMMLFWVITLMFIQLGLGASAYLHLMLTPMLIFFVCQMYYNIRRKILAELVMFFFLLFIFAPQIQMRYKFYQWDIKAFAHRFFIQSPWQVSNASVLVLGDQKSYYLGNHLASPYLNWRMSLTHFGDVENYYALLDIYSNLKKDMPDYIVDYQGIFEGIRNKIPFFSTQYIAYPSHAGVFVRDKRSLSVR